MPEPAFYYLSPCKEWVFHPPLERHLWHFSKREIFVRRAMVDQARESFCYQRKTLHFGVLNIEKIVRSVMTGFLLRKLSVFACCKSHQQWYVFIVVLSHRKLDLSFFFMARPKSANLQLTSVAKIAEENNY